MSDYASLIRPTHYYKSQYKDAGFPIKDVGNDRTRQQIRKKTLDPRLKMSRMTERGKSRYYEILRLRLRMTACPHPGPLPGGEGEKDKGKDTGSPIRSGMTDKDKDALPPLAPPYKGGE